MFTFGSNYIARGTSVSVNNISAPVSQVLDESLLLFMLPAGNTTGPVGVTTAFGGATSSINFGSPISGLAVTGVWPTSGAAGTIVFVFGNNFDPATTSVALNGTVASVTQVLGSTLLLFMVPPMATTGPVSVTIAGVTVYSTVDFVVAR